MITKRFSRATPAGRGLFAPLLVLLLVLLLAATPSSAPPQEQVDLRMVAKIRQEGLGRSQVWATFSQFVDVFGPRLTASPAYNAAARWARDELQS